MVPLPLTNLKYQSIIKTNIDLMVFNMNNNPKNNIIMSENIRQKRLTIPEYFDAYIYHHYQPKIIQ